MLTLLLISIFVFGAVVSADVIIKEYEEGQLLKETDFEDGSAIPWELVTTPPSSAAFSVDNGKFVVFVDNVYNPDNRWDIQLRYHSLNIEMGHTYNVEFTVKANNNCGIYAKIGDKYSPFIEDWNHNNRYDIINLTAGEEITISESFTADRSTDVEFAFHLASAPEGTVLEFDKISLIDPEFEGYPPETIPDYRKIRVNQLGYFPAREKLATLYSEKESALEWWIEDYNGNEVARGFTEVFEYDNDSGEHVHIIDFTDFKLLGRDYVLYADTESGYYSDDGVVDSYPFDIALDMYDEMLYDSLKYFYHARSGEPIEEKYVQRPDLAREAGHTKDIMETSTDDVGAWSYYESFSLDVTGGWYEGDRFGKHVNIGGVAVWTLQNMYERCLYDSDPVAAFGDNTMNIPEGGNGYPDILDETRIQMELMLKMQVPEGYDRAGMVFSSGGYQQNMPIATTPAHSLYPIPEDDENKRLLKPPTTEATLNFAAVAAQSYRLWKEYDPLFADKCLEAAERAWQAVGENPIICGPYEHYSVTDEQYVEDEFYWAAAELFVSTEKVEYEDFLRNSSYFLRANNYIDDYTQNIEDQIVSPFDWHNTATLGTLTLAIVPNHLSSAEVTEAKNNIIMTAEGILNIQESQGYGIPIFTSQVMVSDILGYIYGSNYSVVNSAIVLGYAYDFTADYKYLNGMTEIYDYLMGRNPNERTYVTGYGDYAVENPHHIFFANQVDDSYPEAPPGILVSGPNSITLDSWLKAAGWEPGELAPQKSYMDHIKSWSTNDVSLSWNASLAWGLSFLSENGKDGILTISVKLGDCNRDGNVNSFDAAALRKYLLGMKTYIYPANSDVNEDGNIDSLDFAILRLIITGLLEPEYSISGKVIDDFSGEGMEGVIIRAKQSEIDEDSLIKAVTTDENGNWIMNGLTGDITIYPEKIEYHFEERFIEVSGNREDINFVGFRMIGENIPFSFEDFRLENQIRDIINKPEGAIYPHEVKNITDLKINDIGIRSIDGLQYFTGLKTLNLGNNEIVDLEPLSKLINLKSLDLGENEISNIEPLSNLSMLNKLSLNKNHIEDISPLSNLINLEILYLEENRIKDISPLSNLIELNRLYLNDNIIENINILPGFKNLIYVDIHNNYLDLSEGSEVILIINKLKKQNCKISYLQQKDKNEIENVIYFADSDFEEDIRKIINKPSGEIYISDVEEITSLEVRGMDISFIDGIQHFTNLKECNLEVQFISDITPLSNLTKLTDLNLRGNEISNIEPLSKLVNLINLNLDMNQITDIGSLKDLSNLEIINLSNNSIKDITSLAELYNLNSIELYNNRIADLSPLSSLINLNFLDLNNNEIFDISPLNNLTKLKQLHLDNNKIDDIKDILNLKNLNTLSITENYLDISPGSITMENIRELQVWVDSIAYISQLYSVSGWVNDINGNGIDDVTLNVYLYNKIKNKINTDSYGYWNISDLSEDVIIVPEKTGYTFYPSSIEMTEVETEENVVFIGKKEDSKTDVVVEFENENLENIIREKINKPSGHIYKRNVEGIKKIDIYFAENNGNIDSIEGIQHLKNLKYLSLSDAREISNLDPLSELNNLEYLDLSYNNIKSLNAISHLTNLKELNISNNPIEDIEYLSNLNNLVNISLRNTNISDLSPLSYLRDIRNLDLSGNSLEDISILRNLTNMTGLRLNDNELSNIDALSNMNYLWRLSLGENEIHDLSPLSEMKNLVRLDIHSNKINNLNKLSNLTKLVYLNMNYNDVSDLSPIENMNYLEKLYMNYNDISEIDVLLNLDDLNRLDIIGNYLLDFSEGSEDISVINELNNSGCSVYFKE